MVSILESWSAMMEISWMAMGAIQNALLKKVGVAKVAQLLPRIPAMKFVVMAYFSTKIIPVMNQVSVVQITRAKHFLVIFVIRNVEYEIPFH